MTGWRDVPVPSRIRRRPVATVGPRMHVPYVAQSIEEKSQIHTRIGTDDDGPLEGIHLVSHKGFDRRRMEAQARDPYDFGEMNEERQRECMLTPRCQVCAFQLSPKGPWWHIAGDPDSVLKSGRGSDGEALQVIVFREPAVCEVCLPYALQVCPGIRRGTYGRQGEVTVYRVWRRELAVEVLDLDPRFGREPRKRLVSFGLARQIRALLVCYNVVSLAVEWEGWSWQQWLEGKGKEEPPKHPRQVGVVDEQREAVG